MATESDFHVFLSHNSADKPAVEALYHRLQQEKIEGWIDKFNLVPGQAYQPAIEDALRKCETCAVFIGPSGMGPWQHEEMRAAIARRIEDRTGKFRVVPVLLPGAERDKRSNLPTFLVATTWVEFRKSLEEPEPFHRLICGIRGVPPKPPPSQTPYKGQCPYRGLRFFDVEHSPFFFGRDALVEWLLDAISPMKRNPSRFLAILGASGSGKSSVARAGLIAALKKGGLPGSETWPVAICRPGQDPVQSLVVELAKIGILNADPGSVLQCADQMTKNDSVLHLAAQLKLPNADSRLVIMVDQFEELFTTCSDEKLRSAFLQNLLHAAFVAQGQVIVVPTMRADFLGKCSPYPRLAAAMSDYQNLVEPMSETEMREAIERPALMVGMEIEPGLAEALLRDAYEQSGSLPLLQDTMAELWNRRDGRVLRNAAYQEIGGLKGALEKRANAVFDGLSDAEKMLCQQIFLRLTHPGEGAQDTKRRVAQEELATAANRQQIDTLVRKLADDRLLTTEGEGTKAAFVEVAHEALIRNWSKLRGWVEAGREGLRIHRHLTEEAQRWNEKGRRWNYLYSGAKLEIALEWSRTHGNNLNDQEIDFLTRSIRRRTLIYAAVGCVTVLLAGLTMFSVYQWLIADAQRKIALINESTAKRHLANGLIESAMNDFDRKDTPLGMFKLWQSYYAAPKNDPIRQSALRLVGATDLGIPLRHGNRITCMASTRDGDTVVTGSWDKTARLWDVKTGKPLHEPLQHQESVLAVGFSPDGQTVVTGSEDKTARLWDVKTGKPLHEPLQHQDSVFAIAFSPDGQTVVTGSKDKTARLWDVKTGNPLHEPLQHQDSVFAVVFSPDGHTVLTGSFDKTARLWDAKTGRPLLEPLQHKGSVVAVAFSPDGQTVLTGSFDATARLWDAETGKPLLEPLQHKGSVSAVAFSPDGKTVLTGSWDHTARLWDARTGKPRLNPLQHQGSVNAVAFSPDGKTVLTGSDDKTARLWDARYNKPLHVPLQHRGYVVVVAFSPDGQTVLTGSDDKTARLWAVNTREPLMDALQHQDEVNSATFSPDGQTVLTASRDGTARLWDARTGKPLLEPLQHNKSSINAGAFSPDGKSVLTGSRDGTARLWDARTGKPLLEPLQHESSVTAVAFIPNGATVVTASSTIARLWDVRTGKLLHVPLQHKSAVTVVTFSPDGQSVLTVSEDKAARLWDVKTGNPLHEPLQHQDRVTSGVFSPDGQFVLTGSLDKTARLWDVKTGKPLHEPLQHQGTVTSVAFSPDGQSVLTGGSDKYARLWDATTGKPLYEPLQHQESVIAIAFSPDGQTVLTGSWDKTARLWDAKTGKPLHEPRQHQGAVNMVAFSPDGRTFLTAGRGQTSARLWTMQPPAAEKAERLRLSVEVRTGYYLDTEGVRRELPLDEWFKRRKSLDDMERLDKMGGFCDIRTWDQVSEAEKRALRTPLGER